jgi:hypothetical protein
MVDQDIVEGSIDVIASSIIITVTAAIADMAGTSDSSSGHGLIKSLTLMFTIKGSTLGFDRQRFFLL